MERAKIILIASCVVVLGAVGFFGFLAMRGFTAASEAESTRDSRFRELGKVYEDEIFPNNDNVEKLREYAGDFENVRQSITNSLIALDIQTWGLSPSQFKSKVQDAVLALRKEAPVVEGKKSVAADFAFGFDRYIGSAMPNEKNVPRLTQQLIIISLLTRQMYGAGVSQVLSIEREVFDGGEQSAAAGVADESASRSSRSARRRRTARQDDEPTAEKSQSMSIVTDLYSAQHFKFEFIARQVAAIDFLNRVAKMNLFAIVSNVSIEKTGSDVRILSGAVDKKDDRASARRPKLEEVPAVEEEISSLPPGQRLMSGPDIDPPLKVVVDIDVYNFGKGK